jgi:hypothetical protein
LLAVFVGHGYLIVDDRAGRPAGDLAPFIRSGLLDERKPFPLSMLQQITYEANCAEVAFMAHNVALTLQAMGLGGLYYTGLNRWSILGAFAEEGIEGLGFRFVQDERWTVPNPVGLDGVFEALCPPYFPDMRAAVQAFVDRKFGPGGAYDPGVGGPWKQGAEIKRTVEPYSEEFEDCLGEIAQYVYDKHGRFPGRSPRWSRPVSCRPTTSTLSSPMPTTSQGRIWRPTPTTCGGGTAREATDEGAIRSCRPPTQLNDVTNPRRQSPWTPRLAGSRPAPAAAD